jgi:hypothetical protein
MGNNGDLKKTISEIIQKSQYGTSFSYVENGNPEEDIEAYRSQVEFTLSRLSKNFPNESPPLQTELFFLLDFEIPKNMNRQEPCLIKRYSTAKRAFERRCDAFHPGDVIEITYSEKLRMLHAESVCGLNRESYPHVPMIFYPLGFNAYTTPKWQLGHPVPEVVGVKL